MYTRTVTVRVAPEKVDEVVALWRDEAVAAARRQPGCIGGQLLFDRASGVPRCFVWTPTFKIRAGVEPDGGVGSWLAELSTCPAGGC